MKKITFILLAALTLLPASLSAKKNTPGDIVVISYNIRVGTAKDGTNSWSYRAPATAQMILDQKPDIFGLQEAVEAQLEFINEYCRNYKGFGVGREDGKDKGEHMSIYYNKKTIKMLKWGTFWLSETPEEPSKGWDADCMRSATWALLKDKASGKKFYYVNTHLDHIGWEARKNGLKLIVDRIDSINPEHYPMILTGDFNMTIDRPEFDDLKKIMKNTRESAVKTDHSYTYNGWGDKSEFKIIDYIWYKGFSSCTEYQTITKEYYGRKYISDHYPVKATLIF